jgi:hypothetical protein
MRILPRTDRQTAREELTRGFHARFPAASRRATRREERRASMVFLGARAEGGFTESTKKQNDIKKKELQA